MWQLIHHPAALEPLLAASADGPVMLFKHSTTCGVSDHALSELREFCRRHPEATVGVVEVRPGRAASDAIAQRTGVRHESPQALLLENGSVVWHASHFAIDAAALSRAFAARSSPATAAES